MRLYLKKLNTKLKLFIFRISKKWIGEEPQIYKENSLEAFLYIASLAMLIDHKAKEEELAVLSSYTAGSLLHTFNDAVNSSDENDIDIIKFKVRLDRSDIKRRILDDIMKNVTFNIQNFPTKIIIKNAANSITGEGNRKLSLLSAIRVIACDLEIKDSESTFLDHLARFWDLKELLADIKDVLPKWEEKRTKRLMEKLKKIEDQASEIVDGNSITMSTYKKLEEKIIKIYPKLEIKEEWEEVAREWEKTNKELEEKDKKQHEELQELITKKEKLEKELKRITPYGNSKKCVELFLIPFTRLDIHSSAVDVLMNEFPDKQDIYRKLQKINAGYPPQNKKFNGVKSWKEIANIKTGNHTLGNRGRIYFKKEQKSYNDIYKIYISVKKNDSHQKNQVSNMLKLWI